MVGLLGRPDPAFFEQLVAAHPELTPELSGTGPCVALDAAGEVIEENFDSFTAIIEAYEAEQQRRCDAVPQCRTDGGVRAAYVDVLENFRPTGTISTFTDKHRPPNHLARRRGPARTRGRHHLRRVIDRTRKLTLRRARQSAPTGVATPSGVPDDTAMLVFARVA